MSSAMVREMSSVSRESGASGRTEIRKKQNRDSARRSREKRKTHLRGVFASVEQQTRRVRELDARVAMLEALVNREVKPRGRPRANVTSAASQPRTTIVEEQKVAPSTETPCAPQELRSELDFNCELRPPAEAQHPEFSEIDCVLALSTSIDQRLPSDDPPQIPETTLAFPPGSPIANLAFPVALDPTPNVDQTADCLAPTPSADPWHPIPDATLPDTTLDVDCSLEGFIVDF